MSANRWATLSRALCIAAVSVSAAIAQAAPPPASPGKPKGMQPAPPALQAAPAPDAAKNTPAPTPASTPADAGLISLDVKGADIHSVLAAFSRRRNIPITAGPEVVGKVTVMIKDVPWEIALGQVLEACNCSYVKEAGAIKVVPKGPAAPAPLQLAKAESKAAEPPAAAPSGPGAKDAPSAAPPAGTPVPASTPSGSGAAAPPAFSSGVVVEELPATPAAAQPTPGAATPQATPGAEGKAPVATPVGSPTSGKVTFDFKDADMVNILRIFSMRYGINVIAGPEVKGKVTIRLVDVPWETALKLILESNNYSYVKQGNVFRVLSRDQLDKEPLDTKVFALSYAQAKDVANSITHLLTPQRGQLKPDDRSNTLVVTDIPKKLNDIEEVIYRLDRRTPQIMIEARILELSDDFDENIGINWVALKGYNVSIGPPEGEGLYSIVQSRVRGREDTSADIFSDILTGQDTKTSGATGSDTTTTTVSTVPGSDIGTTITTTNSDVTEDSKSRIRDTIDGATGIQGGIAGVAGKTLPMGQLSPQLYGVNQGGSTVVTTELTQAVLTPGQFRLTLNFLQEQTDANLISHPKIVTADNKESTMRVTEQWPIANYQFNNDTGTYVVNGFEWKDIGIILKVKPHVNEDDFINMRVSPEVSNKIGEVNFAGATGMVVPVISLRKAETDVLIRNGQTLAIGGMMRENEADIVNKVPLLGEIPLVGPYLFANSSKIIRNNNILIFVTANVVTEENKDGLWLNQREEQNRQLNIPKAKWWEPKKLRHGLGSVPGY